MTSSVEVAVAESESMRLMLEIHSGPAAGKKTWLRPGQALDVGRTERSEFVVPHDGQMSSRHFALQCDHDACRVRDLDSTNGTLLNGKRVLEAIVREGDQIVAGRTTFVVHIEGIQPTVTASLAVSENELDARGGAVGISNQSTRPEPDGGSAFSGLQPARTPAMRAASTTAISIPPLFLQGLSDDDPIVRHEALLAAAWTKQDWLLNFCRKLAQTPSREHWDELMLLAILGKPSDAEFVLTIGKTAQLGPKRYEVLGTFGHPSVIEVLLKRIESQDPVNAPAAGLAFTKITGADIASEKSVWLPDEADAELTEETELVEVSLPSAQRAWDYWKKVRDQFSKGTRWRRGFDLSRGASEETLARLDMESRWEACLRGKFHGTWNGTPMDLDVFPPSRR